MSKQSRPNFVVTLDCSHRKLKKNVINSLERRVGNFIEVINDKGMLDYRVDFRLGGGMYYNYLITELISDEESINSLIWILKSNFPDEIKQYILKLLKKHKLIDKDYDT
jgi:hypothetical protein